ncbi:protoporphyrinogen oxidase [Litchfieldia alkalitelluris]|uniref:protoporphyrinogen oxidase n=1 Tax=Litchfieldia alkalitelluris TaxID=304268 RepID=UPI000997E11D|nr:protoporphyrinogen oxidase [Litchfieldia alkalitelluris]
MKTVVVVGGGITGLSTMYYLQKIKMERNLDVKLILVERNEYLGGKIHSVKHDEFIMETGADSIVARHESVLPLIKEINLEAELTYNATGVSYIYTNNKLHPIPKDTVFGIPMSRESLFSSTLISEEGKKEALKDFKLENEHFTKESSVGEFLEYFLGKELVEKQIGPVLSGVYSGDLYKLTLASTLPYLLEYKNQFGSIIEGLSHHKEKFKASADKKFISFKGGLSALLAALEKELEETKIIKGVETLSIESGIDKKYEVSFANHPSIITDYAVLATPHQVAQSILKQDVFNDDFTKLRNSSLTSVYLGFDIPDENLPADGTGFIVSENNDIHCDACTWTSRKWEHTSEKRNLLVRLFYKSSNPYYEKLKGLNKEELVQVALDDIKKSIKIEAKPKVAEVTPWKDLMPNYSLEHSQAITALTNKISEILPGVILAGSSYFGVGIGACIQNGKETAEGIARELS